MSKAKDAAFYKSIREHLLKLIEYVLLIEKNSTNLEDEMGCILENFKSIEYRFNSHIRLNELSKNLKKKKL